MMITGRNRRTRGKTYFNATSSTTNLACNHPGLNLGLRGEKPASS
jgi:hypothetical protein